MDTKALAFAEDAACEDVLAPVLPLLDALDLAGSLPFFFEIRVVVLRAVAVLGFVFAGGVDLARECATGEPGELAEPSSCASFGSLIFFLPGSLPSNLDAYSFFWG